MIQKIDSFMVCSELDSSTTNESDSTISFGQAIVKKKYLSQKTATESIFEQTQHQQKPERITLKQIFNQYSNDPLSFYTLKLAESKQDEDMLVATKIANERFGKYTTSIERQEFQQLSKPSKYTNYQPKSQSPKLTKISSILRMIYQRKGQQNLCLQENIEKKHQNQIIQNFRQQNDSQLIKIQDRQNLDQHQKIQNTQNRERSESDLFLGIESNLSNKLFETTKKSLLSANKKIESGMKKQPLSPVPQNPERKFLKINSPRQKTNSNFRKYEGVVSGLQFSKKLRKKNIHNRNLQTEAIISDFQLKA